MTALLVALLASGFFEADRLEPLVARLQSAESLHGSFVRTDYRVLTMESDTSRGSFVLAAPNLFLLEFTDPAGRRIGFDGDRAYTVEPQTRQVLVYQGRQPDSFMGTLCSCSDSSRLDSASVEGDSVTVWLRGTDTGIETITAGYTLSDSLPFLYATTDANGNTITYRLGTVTVEGEADHGIFELCIPEGYAVARP